MTDTVIRTVELSKKYVIGQRQPDRLREALTNVVSSWTRRLLAPRKAALHHKQEEFWALKEVSFEIQQGDKVGIIGRNGSGKSTLLKVMSRITEPTSGRIAIRGRVASLLEVGTGFHPELTGRENIFLNGAILGMSQGEIKKKFDEIVDFAEVERFLDTPVKRYSSGMYVRLAFAVAAHLEPEILFVDEVLAVGDSQFQNKCLGKMGEVAAGGRTVLFVSHNMQAIRRLCSRAIYLEHGRAEVYARVEDALDRYAAQAVMSSHDIDLSIIRKPNEDESPIRLKRVRLAAGCELSYGRPLELIVTVESRQKLSGIAIGVGFDTMDGSRVMTLDSDQSLSLQLPAGEHEIGFCLERNPLHPGTYSISLAVMSRTLILDAAVNGGVWEVDAGVADASIERGYGGCRLPFKVLVNQLCS
ncbi:MAG: ABC transporter ATP-binding protein [Gemmatimonadaceae bacterium]|nr:ABC transporter ATP-binding protein [Gloeobacterales cyanobacterium ES-bin-141]